MRIPDMCYRKSSFDSDSAGWYVHNSIYVKDIYPIFREPGGGVTSGNLLARAEDTLGRAIEYTESNIATAKRHHNKLGMARNKWIKNKEAKEGFGGLPTPVLKRPECFGEYGNQLAVNCEGCQFRLACKHISGAD